MDYKFVFDLDSTITKEEILPIIAKEIGLYEQIKTLTEKAMKGEEDFSTNFTNRINMLKNIPILDIQKIVANIKLNKYIEKFILENNDKCYIVTGNVDIIVEPILKRLNMQDRYFSCQAIIKNGKIQSLKNIMDKKNIVEKFDFNFVAIGDGDNDIDMLEKANIGIAFGGSREISKRLKESADYVIYNDEELYNFLNNLIRG